MAENSLLKEIIIRAKAEGVENSTNALDVLQVAVDAVGASGALATPEVNKLTSALHKMGATSRTSSGDMRGLGTNLKSMVPEFQELHSKVSDMTVELQKQAQIAAAAGSQTPMKDAIKATGFSQEDVKLVERYNEAVGVNATSATRTFRTEQEAASKQTATYNQYLYDQEKALLKQGDAAQKSAEGYISLRYALYDVSRTALVASAAIAGVGVATIKSFADTESGFSALERTSGLYGSALEPLRNELLELSRILPVATADIQSFAARGAQLGIPTDSIVDFTETIAKFVATSPEVDINSVAEAFGRISNLTGSEDFTALASSIALVGVNAAATDQQIIKTTQEFARAAATTSLTADEIIGISAAFASLGVQPEAARGVANQFFTQLNKGAAGLNESMAVAAQMMGVTEQAAASLFKTDTGTFFQNFVSGLSNVDDVTLALNNMGLEGARLGPAFSALAKNTRENAAGQSVLSRAMADANQGFRERIELDRQFAPIADDVNSKVLLIANAFRELAFDIGQQLAPTLGFALDGIKNLINGLSDFIQTPVGESIVRMVATLSGLAIVAGGLVAILAGVAASGLAVRFALQQIAGSGFVAAFSGIANAIRGIGIASATSAGLAVALGNALKYVGRVTVIGAILYAASELIFNFGGAMQWAGGVLVEFTNFLFEAARNINNFFGGVEVIATSGGFTQTVNDWGKSLKSWGASLGSTNSKVSDFSAGQLGLNGLMDEFGSSIAPGATDAAGDYGDAVGGAAQEVRTLLDYSGDLAKVWDRAFEIRFSGQSTLDAVTSSFISIREAADAAAKRIRDLNNDISKLNSDINIQEYFLSIAVEYGDTKRAEAIEAELAKKRADLADKTLELQNQQDAANKSLVGNSKAAIDNRKQITDLIKQYQGHIQALAASGMSQDQLAQATARLKQDFINQATQLGYNRGELEMYAKAFDDVAVAISKVPRNITVSANADPAIQAFNEYEAALNRARANASRGVPAVSMPVTGYVDKGARDALFAAWVQDMRRIHGVNLAQSPAGWADVRRKWDAGVWGQFAQGGYTGAGGKYEPAGIVHRGEYVIPKHMVNQSTGLPYADALGRLSRGVGTPASYAQGGYVNPPTQTAMHIAPGSIEALANAVSKVLVVDGKVLADSSARVYGNETVTGSF